MTRPRLPDVTLMTATSVNVDEAHEALLHCARCVEFGAVKMLSSTLPRIRQPEIEYVQIGQMDFRDYSRFIIEGLNAHVGTSHCLIVQGDGFIVDPARWRDQFLDYDYIGAPWPEYVGVHFGNGRFLMNKNRVGNGGFSLRSKRLLEATSRLKFDSYHFPLMSEDVLVCHYLYDEMCSAGIRFAPPETAAVFSIESVGIYGQSFDSVFGFHGKHWLSQARAKSGWRFGLPPRPPYRVTVTLG